MYCKGRKRAKGISEYEVPIAQNCRMVRAFSGTQHTNNVRQSCTPWCLGPLLSLCYKPPPWYQTLFTRQRHTTSGRYAVKLVEASDLVAILDEVDGRGGMGIGSIWRGGHCQELPWSSSGADRRLALTSI
eukprot:scaffold314261_cov63-Attheya_sp.AAC.2